MSKCSVFTLTFLAYAQVHGFRNIWSYLQNYVKNEQFTENQIGLANLTFLFSYGICMNLIGPICCKYSLKHSIGSGCFATGCIAFGLGALQYYEVFYYPYVFAIMLLNGIAQSTPYPGCVNVVGNWFKNAKVGLTMGLWSGCTNLGDIFGLIVGDIIIQRLIKPAYWGFFIFGICLFTIGFLVHIFLQESPKNYVEIPIEENLHEGQLRINTSQTTSNQKNINIFTAWKVPGLAYYALIYGCLKGTFYGFLFWLPFYFQQNNLENHSSYISQMFDVGSFLGGVIIGLLGDIYKKRLIFFCPFLIIAMSLMLIVKFILDDNPIPYYFVILIMGFTLGGPYNNCSGVIGIELSATLDNDKAAISTLTSLIESFGTITAAVFQLFIPYMGSDKLFLFFCCVTFVAEITCWPLLIKEINRNKKK